MSTIKVNNIQNANGTSAIAIDSSGVATFSKTLVPSSSMMYRNLIINGDMKIDQRNAGASVTPSAGNTYTLDRWLASANQASKFTVQQNAASITPPSSFEYYLGATSSSAYSVLTGDYLNIQQRIEGFNVNHLGWGTSAAKTVTLSFWVRSSLTGTFGGAIKDNTNNYSYPYSYTISSANTWEQKSITIAGPTAGSWSSTTGIGMQVLWSLGAGATYSGTAGSWSANDYRSVTGATSVVGTSGATFYITGVQLEVGDAATPFEHRPYGAELALCYRYYYQVNSYGFINMTTNVYNGTIVKFPVSMRVTPTCTLYSTTTGTSGKIYYQDGATDVNAAAGPPSGTEAVCARVTNISTNTGSNMYFKITASSEL